MSAGNFEDGKYLDGFGHIYPCRVQPETKGLTIDTQANDYPTGAVTANLPSIKLTAGRSEYGVIPRKVVVELTANGTTQTLEYKAGQTYYVPWFDPTTFGAITKGATGTYLGIACKVNGKIPQLIR